MAETKEGSSGNPILKGLAPIVAVVALLAFAVFVWFLLGQINSTEPAWSRSIFLFSGVEAIAFAAAGFLFGREVHREQAAKAEERADKNQKDADGGRALSAAVKAKATTVSSPRRVGAFSHLAPQDRMVATQATTQEDLEELASLAETLFPEPKP